MKTTKPLKILFPDGQEFLVNGYVSADENRDLVMIRLPKNVKGISPVPLKIDNAIDQILIGSFFKRGHKAIRPKKIKNKIPKLFSPDLLINRCIIYILK